MKRGILIIGRDFEIFEQVKTTLLEAGFNADIINRRTKLDDNEIDDENWGLILICIHSQPDFEAIQMMPAKLVPLVILCDTFNPDLLEVKGWNCLQLQELRSRSAKLLLKKIWATSEYQGGQDQLLTEVLDFEQMVFQNPIPMWVYDRVTYKFLYVNQAAINMYGYSAAEFASMTIRDIRPEEDVDLLVSNIRNRRGQRIWRHRKKSGDVFFVDVLACDLNYRERDLALVTAIDINEKVLAASKNEQLLQMVNSQKERLDDLLTNMNEVVWQTRTDNFQLLYTNPASFRVYGYTPEEMMNDPNIFINCIHPEDKDTFEASIKQALTEGKTESKFRVRHKDGTIKYLKGNAVLKKGHDSIPDTLSGLTIDITNMVLSQDALLAKSMELEHILLKVEQQNERLREIAWIQSHKVRSHVAAIMGLVEILNLDDISDSNNVETLQHILKVSHELDNTIKEINDKTNAIDN